jgi:circadian clock protein KaiC
MAPATHLERCVTGIEGLDNILSGGIPRGNMVLVAGSVGTGKTTLCLEFLVRGAERGERSLFLSVTEASDKLIQNLSTFEFFRTELVTNGSLVFVDLPVLYERLGLEHEELTEEEIGILIRTIRDLVRQLGVKRLVLDSLTSVGYRIRRDERIRDFMLRLGLELSDAGARPSSCRRSVPRPAGTPSTAWRRRSWTGLSCCGTPVVRATSSGCCRSSR